MAKSKKFRAAKLSQQALVIASFAIHKLGGKTGHPASPDSIKENSRILGELINPESIFSARSGVKNEFNITVAASAN